MTITGRVVKLPFGGDSKSAYEAVRIESDAGPFVLRRVGGNPFRDPVLDDLIGKTIRATGVIQGYQFVMTAWTDEGLS